MELMLSLLKWSVIVGAAALLLTLFKPLLDRRYSAKWRWGASPLHGEATRRVKRPP